jgi:hypothetical protein
MKRSYDTLAHDPELMGATGYRKAGISGGTMHPSSPASPDVHLQTYKSSFTAASTAS